VQGAQPVDDAGLDSDQALAHGGKVGLVHDGAERQRGGDRVREQLT